MTKWMAVLLAVMVLAGCNTINGMGKDIEQAGEAVQKSSK
ncbi:entericidin A/B family lipoprotein [Methylophilus sp. 5]|nr:entericidin A/B family lipoprotein [Methylophilus sp. 5]